MTTENQTKPRYWIPTVSADIDVSLDQFDAEEIAEYLRHSGYAVFNGSAGDFAEDPIAVSGIYVNQDDLNRISTLALCGQLDAARSNALAIISNAIGRAL